MTRWAAGLVCVVAGALAGCGGGPARLPGLVLADSKTGAKYSLDVVGGALTLEPAVVSGAVPLQAELVDQVGGAGYELGVASAALVLVPEPNAGDGAKAIGLVDTVTAAEYSLAVVRGGLTLLPG